MQLRSGFKRGGERKVVELSNILIRKTYLSLEQPIFVSWATHICVNLQCSRKNAARIRFQEGKKTVELS